MTGLVEEVRRRENGDLFTVFVPIAVVSMGLGLERPGAPIVRIRGE
jgi:hypothetical protein